MNFVAAHPRLTAILAGLGISIVFSSLGRFFVHEALATTTTSAASSPLPLTYDPQDGATSATTTPSFQVDYIDKTHISTVPGHVQMFSFLLVARIVPKTFLQEMKQPLQVTLVILLQEN